MKIDGKLSEILQPLILYGIQQKYLEVKENFQLLRMKLESIRQTFSADELREVDDEIEAKFSKFNKDYVTIETVKQMKELVFQRGARLECDNNELGSYNLASVLNDWLTPCINNNQLELNSYLKFYSKLVEILFVSNPDLVDNRGYVGNGGLTIEFFLLYCLFGIRTYWERSTTNAVNVKCFRILLNIFLLILQHHLVTAKGEEHLVYRVFNPFSFQQDLLFISLDKKERKILEESLIISPNLINQLDKQGNNPLLYITLNVSGCRHRIIEMLIRKGCDTGRINANGQTFRDALHLPRNRKLLATLIEHEIIE